MALIGIFNADQLSTVDSFKVALENIISGAPPPARGLIDQRLVTVKGLAVIERHMEDFTENPGHLHTLIRVLIGVDSVWNKKYCQGDKTAYLRALKLLKVAKEKFRLNYCKLVLILHDYIDLLVEKAIAENNPITTEDACRYSKRKPLFPRGVFTTSAHFDDPIAIRFSEVSQQQKEYLWQVIENDEVTKNLLENDSGDGHSMRDKYEPRFKLSSTQALREKSQEDMIGILTQAGKMTDEKKELLGYVEARASQPDTRFFSLRSSNISRIGKLKAAEKLYHALSDREEIMGVNYLVQITPALRGGNLGRIAHQVIARVNLNAKTLLENSAGFMEAVSNIKGLSFYMKHCSEEDRDSILTQILENNGVLQNLITSSENLRQLITFSPKNHREFSMIVLSNHSLLKHVVKDHHDLWDLYGGIGGDDNGDLVFDKLLNSFELMNQVVDTLPTLNWLVDGYRNFRKYKDRIFEKVLYHSEILDRIAESTYRGDDFFQWCKREFPNHPMVSGKNSIQEFLDAVRKNNSKGDIIQAARVLRQAKYPLTECASSLLGSRSLPEAVLIKIAAYVGNPSFHNEKEAVALAQKNFNRPSKRMT